jgi:predicted permease
MPTPLHATPTPSRPHRWDAFTQDLRYAIRGLRNRPGFTVAVVLTLAIGIGANAAMFSVVDRLLFRPPPLLKDAALTHRIYLVRSYRGRSINSSSVPYARYRDLTNWTHAFSRTAEVTTRSLAIGLGADSRELPVAAVSAGFFGFFDAPPALGRYFTTAEDTTPTGTPVAVLSFGYWRTAYGGRPDVAGGMLQIGPREYRIIGVAPRGFVGLWPAQPPVAYVPITVYGADGGFNLRGETWWTTYHWTWAQMIAERRPDVSVAAADADLTQAFLRSYRAQLEGDHEGTPVETAKPHGIAASVLSERGPNESSEAKVATWVAGVALIVWLIACANVANLLLARALRRKREIAVRIALGVSRARLASQLLIESLLLALLAGLAGALIAQFGGAVLRAELLPKTADAGFLTDPRSLAFAGLAALAAGFLTALAPMLQAQRADLSGDLKAGEREGGVHRSRLGLALLVMQAALSVVLLVGAGLFVRSLRNVDSLPLGYDADPVLIADLQMRGVTLDSAANVTLRERLLEEARTIPGVTHVTRRVTMPFFTWSTDLHVTGIDSVERLGEFDLNAVSSDYFTTMGTRILKGRGITQSDAAGAPRVMVVGASMAKALWPGGEALGRCVRVTSDTVPCTTVVGIAEDIKNERLGGEAPQYLFYLAATQFAPDRGGLFIRTSGPAAAVAETVRRRLQPLMPGVSYVTVTPLADVLGSQTRSWRLGATMFTVFGALALLLAAIGLYSVIAYNVAQRTQEMGVRIALGAEMRHVVGLVLREGMTLAIVGVALGGAVALLVSGWVKPLLFGVSQRDPVVFVGVGAVLLAVAALASFIPARRAARVDPMRALRTE